MRTRPRTSPLVPALALACALAAHPARAEDPGAAPWLSFSGYGTIGVAHSSNDQADYLADEFKPTGPGHTRSWSTDVDTRLGAQLSAQVSPRISAVVQVITKQRYDNSYRPDVEWANLKFQATPDFSVRVGRIVLPIYMVTDSRRVGYANPWVRPPVEVYSLVPVTSVDGIDANYRTLFGETAATLQVTFAQTDPHFPNASGFNAGTAKVRDIVAVVGTVERGFLTLRANYGRARISIDSLQPLFDAFRQFGPVGEDLARRFELQGRKVDFVGVGASYDPGRWFLTGEWAKFNTHSVLGSKSAWYVSGGHRFGAFTPYLTYSRIKADSATTAPGLPVEGLPPSLQPTAAFLDQTLNTTLALVPQQHTVSAGVRWDFLRNAALKLQLDEIRVEDASRGTFGNFQPGYRQGSTVRVVSAVVDFVF